MKNVRLLFVGMLLLSLISCDELLSTLEDDELTQSDIIEGLKTALEVGTDSASTNLSKLNAFYGNELLKIPLPPEAEQIRSLVGNNVLSKYFNLDGQFENVVKSINRAAEDAAKEAAPIFQKAIYDLSITQAMEILQGQVPSETKSASAEFDSTAATEYFKIQTFDPLVGLFAPKINIALDKDLGLSFSANDAWNTLQTAYNQAYNTLNSNFVSRQLISQYNLPNGLDADLGEFCTGRALDGLFLKVGEEERKIRRNPFQWALDILQRVFGSVMD